MSQTKAGTSQDWKLRILPEEYSYIRAYVTGYVCLGLGQYSYRCLGIGARKKKLFA